jgi:hypothetical protein
MGPEQHCLCSYVRSGSPAGERDRRPGSLAFEGRDQIRALCEVVLEVFSDLHYTHEVCGKNSAFLVARAHVDGQSVELVDHVRLVRSTL